MYYSCNLGSCNDLMCACKGWIATCYKVGRNCIVLNFPLYDVQQVYIYKNDENSGQLNSLT